MGQKAELSVEKRNCYCGITQGRLFNTENCFKNQYFSKCSHESIAKKV